MTTTATETAVELDEQIRADIDEVPMVTLTLGDLIRAGSAHTSQAYGWGAGREACALSAAGVAARSLGLVKVGE